MGGIGGGGGDRSCLKTAAALGRGCRSLRQSGWWLGIGVTAPPLPWCFGVQRRCRGALWRSARARGLGACWGNRCLLELPRAVRTQGSGGEPPLLRWHAALLVRQEGAYAQPSGIPQVPAPAPAHGGHAPNRRRGWLTHTCCPCALSRSSLRDLKWHPPAWPLPVVDPAAIDGKGCIGAGALHARTCTGCGRPAPCSKHTRRGRLPTGRPKGILSNNFCRSEDDKYLFFWGSWRGFRGASGSRICAAGSSCCYRSVRKRWRATGGIADGSHCEPLGRR